jgi:DNA polymerase/3'-5' exonuclease PolX
VGDIEIVMIPKTYQHTNLLGEKDGPPIDTVQKGIDSYIQCETYPGRKPALERINDGDRYIKLRETVIGIQIDLFVVRPPAEWGPIFAIRTGSADFSRRLVTSLRNRGMRCEGGRVLDRNNRLVSCPEEKDFFKAAGVPLIDPAKR